MPEGNEVHRWAARHTAAFVGRKVNVLPGPNHRFSDAHLVDGKKLLKVHAVGKHLGYEFPGELYLHVHLGRFGDFTEGCGPLPEPKGLLRGVFQRAGSGKPSRSQKGQPHNLTCAKDDGTQPFPADDVDWWELRGPTDCSVYDATKWQALLDRLGPDPLADEPGDHDNPQRAFDKILAKKTSIGELLMDQSILSGIGNIYRAELLFRHRVNPFTPGNEMDLKTLNAIWKDSIPLLKAGMVDRRIVCTDRKDRPSKKALAERGEEHYVYRRHGKPCFVCGETIVRKDVAGRTLYWCPKDQNTSAAETDSALKHGISLRASRAAAKRR
jgi:endonuclease-8